MPWWKCREICSAVDVGNVGIAGLAQRRRHADDHHVHIGDGGRFGGGRKPAGAHLRRQGLGRHVRNVRGAGVEPVDALRVYIDPGDLESGLGEGQRQRQADVAEADDADVERTLLDAIQEVLQKGFSGL